MKITKRQLTKILIKEFKNISGDFGNFDDLDLTGGPPDLPPVEGGDEGGPSKNWPVEVINRLKRIGYYHFVRRDGQIPFKNQVVKKMIDPDVSLTIDALQEGVVIAVNYGKGEHKMIHIAGQKFVQVHNGMDTNKAIGIVVAVAKAIKNRRSEDIQNDLNRLTDSGLQDQEQFTMEDFLNNNAFLIDYYSQQGRR
jgi:hypothetical protein